MPASVDWPTLVRQAAEHLVPLSDHGEGIGYTILGFVFGLWLIYDGFRKWQQMRLMQDTPTEQVESVAVGRTELQGTARELEGTVERPFTDGRCLLATYEVEEWQSDDDGGHWVTLDEGVRSVPFALDDGTGQIRVEPDPDATVEISDANCREITVDGSETEPPEIREFLAGLPDVGAGDSSGLTGMLFDSKRRYTQEVLPVDSRAYVLGGAEPLGHRNVSGTLADDGGQPATPADTVGKTNPERLVVGRDESSEEFIIADQTESQVVSTYRWRAPAQIVGGLALSSVTLGILLFVFGI